MESKIERLYKIIDLRSKAFENLESNEEEIRKAEEKLQEVRRLRHKIETECTKGKTLGDTLSDEELETVTDVLNDFLTFKF